MPAFRTRKTAATRKAKQTVVCDICGARLAGDLKRHLKTHSPPELECSWPGCFHKTSQRTNLKTHFNTHTRERPSRCSLSWVDEYGVVTPCVARFRDASCLNRHHKGGHKYLKGVMAEPPLRKRTRAKLEVDAAAFTYSDLTGEDVGPIRRKIVRGELPMIESKDYEHALPFVLASLPSPDASSSSSSTEASSSSSPADASSSSSAAVASSSSSAAVASSSRSTRPTRRQSQRRAASTATSSASASSTSGSTSPAPSAPSYLASSPSSSYTLPEAPSFSPFDAAVSSSASAPAFAMSATGFDSFAQEVSYPNSLPGAFFGGDMSAPTQDPLYGFSYPYPAFDASVAHPHQGGDFGDFLSELDAVSTNQIPLQFFKQPLNTGYSDLAPAPAAAMGWGVNAAPLGSQDAFGDASLLAGMNMGLDFAQPHHLAFDMPSSSSTVPPQLQAEGAVGELSRWEDFFDGSLVPSPRSWSSGSSITSSPKFGHDVAAAAEFEDWLSGL